MASNLRKPRMFRPAKIRACTVRRASSYMHFSVTVQCNTHNITLGLLKHTNTESLSHNMHSKLLHGYRTYVLYCMYVQWECYSHPQKDKPRYPTVLHRYSTYVHTYMTHIIIYIRTYIHIYTYVHIYIHT